MPVCGYARFMEFQAGNKGLIVAMHMSNGYIVDKILSKNAYNKETL